MSLVTTRVKEEEHQPNAYSSVKDEDRDDEDLRDHDVKVSTTYKNKKEGKVMANKQTSSSMNSTHRKMVCDQIEYTDIYIKRKKNRYSNVKVEVKGEETDDEDALYSSPPQFSNNHLMDCVKAEEVKGEDTDDEDAVSSPQLSNEYSVCCKAEVRGEDTDDEDVVGTIKTENNTFKTSSDRGNISKRRGKKVSETGNIRYIWRHGKEFAQTVGYRLDYRRKGCKNKGVCKRQRPRFCSHSGGCRSYALKGGTLCFSHDPRKKKSRSSSPSSSALSQANVMLILVIVVCCLIPVSSFSFSQSVRLAIQRSRGTNLTSPLSSGKSVDEEPSSSADISSTTQKPHKRRERYSGRYPRNFKDKYKEQRGDEETINKVLAKGITPAGTHVPIMVRECLHYMGLEDNNNDADGQQQLQQSPLLVVDCTLGYGGHSSYILKHLIKTNGTSNGSRLISFDQDSIEIKKTEERLRTTVLNQTSNEESTTTQDEDLHSNLFTAVNQNFANLGSYLSSTHQIGQVTSLLADLGLSSMQIDNNDRGFTYKRSGPLESPRL